MNTDAIFNMTRPFWMGLALCLPLFGGCQEREDPDGDLMCRVEVVTGPEDDVTGKWKLIWLRRISFSSGIDTTDHSCDNIVYHFTSEGLLEVNSDVEDIPYTFEDRIFPYELTLSPHYEGMEGYTLRISTIRWHCHIEASNMTLDTSPLDGPTLHFVRIE